MTDHLVPTPGQTVGPFFGFALPYVGGDQLVPPGCRATRFRHLTRSQDPQ